MSTNRSTISRACVGLAFIACGSSDADRTPTAWWENGPLAEERPAGPPPTNSTNLECDYPDPFAQYIQCRFACHYALVHLANTRAASDGYVMELPDHRLVVMDTVLADVRVEQYLVSPEPWPESSFEAPPDGDFVAREYPTGFKDIYVPGDTTDPTYQRTDWNNQVQLPAHAQLTDGRYVIAFTDSDDVINPEHRLVTFVMPVGEDGMIDFTMFAGTSATRSGGQQFDTPTTKVSVDEARAWFEAMLPVSGIACYPPTTE